MKDENKKYAQVAYDIVTHAAKKIGSRLPGSDNEKKYADYMGDKLREIGIEPKQEEFAVSPRSSIGGIPYAGYAGLILSVLSYFALKIETLWFGMAFFGIAVVVWLVFSVFLYKTWFDMFFRQEISQNTYGELLPPDGKYDYTIILSGHTDTSWTWRHSEHAYKYKHKPALGSCFVIMWADPHGRNASRGAMDNATGCALSYAVTKYFAENPDKMPKNCRIVDFNCGSEEAGLRGSMAFAEEHKNDDLTKNAWNINIDSVADKEYFEVVIKDDWQFTRFDKDLEQMFKDTFKEVGVESKTNYCIHNPVGGCDSTPLTKAGIKSVTFAAQNPVLTYYYHTWRDMPERFDMETVGDGFEVVLGVIDKIAAFQEKNGFNGPQK